VRFAMTIGRIAISCVALVAVMFALGACGDNDGAPDKSEPTGASRTAPEGNRDEPRIPRDAVLCPDLKVDGEFIAFRLFAVEVPCGEVAAVVEAAVKGSPPEGWSCTQGPGTFVECKTGEALIGFNK
jgi:hypothetical protein